MLQNHVHAGVLGPDVVAVFLQPLDALGVVPSVHVLLLHEALGEVPAKPVDVVMLHPVVEVALDKITCPRGSVVPIVEPGEAVGGGHVEPGVVGQHGPVFPVHGDEWVGLVRMVVHHVQDHRDATGVASVHEGLQVVFGPVSLVHREVERGVVSPAVVAVEFIHRHELQRLNAQRLEVVKRIEDELKRAVFGKIPDQQLVNDQVLLVGPLKVVVGPFEGRFSWREHADWPRRVVGWIPRHVGVGAFRNPRVVPLVENDLGIRVGHPDVVGHDVVLVAVILAWNQVGQLDPKRFPVAHIVHHRSGAEGPVVEVPNRKHKVLVRSCPLKHDRAVVQVVDAIHHPGRRRGHWGGVGKDHHHGFVCARGSVHRARRRHVVVACAVQDEVVAQGGAHARSDQLTVHVQGQVARLGGLGLQGDGVS